MTAGWRGRQAGLRRLPGAGLPAGLRSAARVAAVAVALPAVVTGVVLGTVGTAAADETYSLPPAGLAITGHGYGHGHGLGQYGAQGAALQGVGYRDILAHYYPGTVVGPLPAPSTVRVLVSEDTDDDVTVRADPGLALVDADGLRWVLPTAPGAWRVTADTGAVQHVEQLLGTWQRWVSPDGRGAFTQLRFEGPERLRVELPGGGGRVYRGTITVARTTGRALDTVNTVGFEQYLWGVVPRESPSSWRPAALQAQAVAARTYSAYKRMVSAGRTYDLCSTTACQVYGGSATYTSGGTVTEQEPASTTAAVDATAGEVRLYGGRPAFTEFTSSTGGWNSSGGQPYLAAGPDPWDDYAGNPVHTWQATLTPGAVGSAYPTAGSVRRLRVTGRDGGGEGGGRITTMVVEGVSAGGAPTSVSTTGSEFRSRLGLRSEWWVAQGGAIQGHWLELGGAGSYLGAATSDEYDVPGGRAQDFAGGRVYWSPTTGAHAVHGAVLGRYDAAGGPGGLLGLPTADEVGVPGGAAATFVGGNVYWSDATGAQVVHGSVLGTYLGLGGPAGRFGLPVSEEQGHAAGVRARFQHGNVYWSPGTGAQPVEGAILGLYVRLGEGTGPLAMPLAGEVDVTGGRLARFALGNAYWSAATDAHEVYGAVLGAYLGAGGPDGVLALPTDGEQAHADGRRQSFTGGALYWSAGTGAHLVHGAVLGEYRAVGEAAGPVGWPSGEEVPAPGGVVQRFTLGDVYWSAATGAHEVHGAIRGRYLALDGAGGRLGLPTADEADAATTRSSVFVGGRVYWTAATDAHAVVGGILERYLQLGGPGSVLGASVSDEYAVPGGARSDFTGGALVWRSATSDIVVVPR